jgi:hypothetical protein
VVAAVESGPRAGFEQPIAITLANEEQRARAQRM